jgi:ABC-type uncharacterized transport system ATPase component
MTAVDTALVGNDVRLEGVSITYPNGFTAVQPTDLIVKAGEFFSILGPSGCGKTTILRAISGFVDPSAGRILIGGEDQAGRGPNARPTALIFQNLAPRLRRCSIWLRCRIRPTSCRATCRAASASASRSRAPWRWSPKCCCSMSRCRRWT